MNNFLLQDKGKTEFLPRRIVWSPDGSSVIVSSFSNDLQIIKISDFSNPFTIKNPTTVTDIVWYPLMDINNPSSCAYASVCPMCPIYLIDSNDGHIRSSYRCQCKGDRAASLTSLLFNGASILAGGTKALFQCDISRSEKLGTPILKCPGSILSVSSHKLSSIISLGLSTGDLIYIDSRTYECVLTSKFHNHGLDSQKLE